MTEAHLLAGQGRIVARQANEARLRAHLAAENRHDMEGTLATLHPECTFVDEPLLLEFTGREGARRHYDMWWSAFDNAVEGSRPALGRRRRRCG